MVTRTDRLKKLVDLQRQMKALHETRHATFIAKANQADAEALELAERADSHSEITAVFPDLYNRRIQAALGRKTANQGLAKAEAKKVVTATLRAGVVEEAYRESMRSDERDRTEKERLEIIGRSPRDGK